jgi:hypothetical protein
VCNIMCTCFVCSMLALKMPVQHSRTSMASWSLQDDQSRFHMIQFTSVSLHL